MLSCFKKKKNAKGLDRTVLATGSCGPTSVLGVHGITTYAWFFMFKKSVFIPAPDFHGPTSWSGPVSRTVVISSKMIFYYFILTYNELTPQLL